MLLHKRCALLLSLALSVAFSGHAAADCGALTRLDLGTTGIVSAELIAAGEFRLAANGPSAAATNATLATLAEFCRVIASARPTGDSIIGMEIWLPAANWNGRLLAVGNGAWAGSISYAALANGLLSGYAVVSTDTGHTGNNVDFAVGHPEKLVDFAHRAVHEMTVAAKAVVAANYARAPDYAYFSGCSTGGRQALAEAQRYPEDFDGIVSGAPAYYPTHLQGMQVWAATTAANQPGAAVTEHEFRIVNDAVVAACDTIDGVADGVIENPLQCDFDPASLICGGSDTGDCLSPAQAATIALTYDGPVDADGYSIFPGLSRGSEAAWRTLSGDAPLSLAFDTYAQLVFGDPAWDFRTFDAARDIALGVERIGGLMNSATPDLSPFVDRGGKLLLYHGWSDPGIPAEGTLRYYTEIRDTLGSSTADASVRLFMVPGMGHCRGGIGTDQFDPVAALHRWVQSDRPPARIEAARVEAGEVVRTRPLCPYPAQAVFDGSGSTDASENFTCR